jgi:hypothetical protein
VVALSFDSGALFLAHRLEKQVDFSLSFADHDGIGGSIVVRSLLVRECGFD